MQSTLIRFIDSKYADSYLRGELYLSSLSKFWNYMEGKVPCGVDVTDTEAVSTLINTPQDRQDFSEGVAAQIPRDKVSQYFGPMRDHIVHDTFGTGVVVGVEKSILTIAFPHPTGIKKLLKGHKSIRKVEK